MPSFLEDETRPRWGRIVADRLRAPRGGVDLSSRASSGSADGITALLAVVVLTTTRVAHVLLRRRLPGRDLRATRREAIAMARPAGRFLARRFGLSGDWQSATDGLLAAYATASYAQRVSGIEVTDDDIAAGASEAERLQDELAAELAAERRARRAASAAAETPRPSPAPAAAAPAAPVTPVDDDDDVIDVEGGPVSPVQAVIGSWPVDATPSPFDA